jgi:small subunit ribosomal protein S16
MLKIRLRRMGATNKAFYRLIVSDSRNAPGSAALEEVGTYDPRQDPPKIHIDRPRIDYWVSKGAGLSDTVKNIVGRAG